MKYTGNDEYINFKVNDIVNDDFVYFNKAGNHTLENDIENDEFVMTIKEIKVNGNKDHLFKTSSLDQENIVVLVMI